MKVKLDENETTACAAALADQRTEISVDVLRRFLANHGLDDFTGTLVIVSEDRVRIRRTDL